MHFGAAVRDVLSTTCGSDLRAASARTVVPALQSPATQRRLAANLRAAFGVAIPVVDLRHLSTVRDVLQCVRLRRWAIGVEEREQAARLAAMSSAPAVATSDAALAGDDARQAAFRMTRRAPAVDPAVGTSTALPAAKRL
jgi:hypothetical protein